MLNGKKLVAFQDSIVPCLHYDRVFIQLWLGLTFTWATITLRATQKTDQAEPSTTTPSQ